MAPRVQLRARRAWLAILTGWLLSLIGTTETKAYARCSDILERALLTLAQMAPAQRTLTALSFTLARQSNYLQSHASLVRWRDKDTRGSPRHTSPSPDR